MKKTNQIIEAVEILGVISVLTCIMVLTCVAGDAARPSTPQPVAITGSLG